MGVSENKGHLIPRPCGGDPTISVAILGSPIFGNPHIRVLSHVLQEVAVSGMWAENAKSLST